MKKRQIIKRLEKELLPPKEFKAKTIDLHHGVYTDPETGETLTPGEVETLEKSDKYDLVIICNWEGPDTEENQN